MFNSTCIYSSIALLSFNILKVFCTNMIHGPFLFLLLFFFLNLLVAGYISKMKVLTWNGITNLFEIITIFSISFTMHAS